MDYRWSFYCFDTFLGILKKKKKDQHQHHRHLSRQHPRIWIQTCGERVNIFLRPSRRSWQRCLEHPEQAVQFLGFSFNWKMQNPPACVQSASDWDFVQKLPVCATCSPVKTDQEHYSSNAYCCWLINIIDILTLYERSVVGILLRCRTISEMILKN